MCQKPVRQGQGHCAHMKTGLFTSYTTKVRIILRPVLWLNSVSVGGVRTPKDCQDSYPYQHANITFQAQHIPDLDF
mgnify:CR=1 FL=1